MQSSGKHTYFGDTNLDGQISGDDYGAVDGNLGQTGISPGIAGLMGDTNYDSNITGDDYGAIDVNLGLGVDSALAGTPLPDPASFAAILILPMLGLCQGGHDTLGDIHLT